MSFINNNDEWYIVKDIDGFIESARILVFNNFGKKDSSEETNLEISISDKEEIDKILSFEESEIICKELLKKKTTKDKKSNRFIVNDDIFLSIIQSLNDRMVSNILNSLVNRGLVETAYDSDSDDFVFWMKDDVKNKIENPETD